MPLQVLLEFLSVLISLDFASSASNVAGLQLIYIICLLGFFSVLAVEKIIYVKALQRDRDAGLKSMPIQQSNDDCDNCSRDR